MANFEPWGSILKIEETHKGFVKLLEYSLRQCGGLLWPLSYGFLYWYGRDCLSVIGQIVFFFLGIPLTIIGLLYPYAWRKRFKEVSNAHRDTVEMDVNNLLWAIQGKCKGLLSYGPFEEEAMKLENSLRQFRKKFE